MRSAALPLAWAACIAASEILGRRSPSDVWDAIGVCVLSASLGLTVYWIMLTRRRLPAWVERPWHWLIGTLASWWPEMGVDLRGKPPWPSGFPTSLIKIALLMAVPAVLAFLGRDLFPGPARQLMLQVSPTIWFIGLGGAWTALLALLAAATFSVWLDLHDLLWNAGVAPVRQKWIEGLSLLACLSLVAVLAFLVPIWICWTAIGIASVCAGLSGVVIIRHEPLLVAWRHDASQPPQVFSAGWGIGWDCVTMGGLLLAIGIPATGIGWSGALSSTAPITIGLGAAASWAGCIAFLSWAVNYPIRTSLLARHDPSVRGPISIRLEPGSEIPPDVEGRLSDHGFRPVRAGARGEAPGLALRVDEGALSPDVEATDTAEGVRVRVHPAALVRLGVLAELRRLDNELRRTSLLAGLRHLFRFAARRGYSQGSGFWLAPHLWYVRGLSRDEDEMDLRTIGPPYHKVLPLRARQHLHQVLDAVDVDLMFVEDGIPFDDISLVLSRIFDVYDILGPGPIEEKDFMGIPRVHVIVHDFTLGDPFEREGYSEPSYEEIGRARILHVMVERGDGDEEEEPVPEAPEKEPTFALV